MLSQEDILNSVKSKDIFIEHFNKKNLKTCSYYLHLDDEFAFPQEAFIDASNLKDVGKAYVVKKLDNIIVRPNQFVLGRTLEKISISTRLEGFVDGRTTLARLGISVNQTASLILAGHGVPRPRKIVFEIKNNGPFEIALKKGMPICKLSFFKLETPEKIPSDKTSKYSKRKNLDDLLPV